MVRLKPENIVRGDILYSTIESTYREAFGMSDVGWLQWLQRVFGFASEFQFADAYYKEADEELIEMILDADMGDREDYETEWYDCEVPVEAAYGLGLFYADGSCGLREEGGYSGAFWRIVNWNLAWLERVKASFEQQWEDMVFPIRQYPDYLEGSDTNYGARKKTLYCLEVAPMVRSNNGDRGMFIEKFRATSYDKQGNKKVPAGVLESSAASKRAFLQGVLDGDGHERTPSRGTIYCHGMMQVTELMDLMLDCGWKFRFGRDNGEENYWIYFNRKHEKLSTMPACDDFAFSLMGVFHDNKDTAAMPIFITWVSMPEGGHAVISYCKDGVVRIIEPQTDEIYDVPDEWKLMLLCG